jgi:hypothetical protein
MTFQPTVISWILIIFGVITVIPLLVANMIMLLNPKGKEAKDILIGEGQEWRDNTHFKSQFALAFTDWLIFVPLFLLGIIGIFKGQAWGYFLFAVSGAIQLYINVFLWFLEKEYVYPSQGPLKYFTYYWGNFIYWGAVALLYGLFRLQGYIF